MSLRARILRYIEPKVAHCHVALELRVWDLRTGCLLDKLLAVPRRDKRTQQCAPNYAIFIVITS